MNTICENCKFFVWKEWGTLDGNPALMGDCRLNPPTVVPSWKGKEPLTQFPEVFAVWTCGKAIARVDQ